MFSSSQDVRFPFHVHSMQICTVSFQCFCFISFSQFLVLSTYNMSPSKTFSWSHLCKWTRGNSKHYLLVANTQYECDLIKGNIILWHVGPCFKAILQNSCGTWCSHLALGCSSVASCLFLFFCCHWSYKCWDAWLQHISGIIQYQQTALKSMSSPLIEYRLYLLISMRTAWLSYFPAAYGSMPWTEWMFRPRTPNVWA